MYLTKNHNNCIDNGKPNVKYLREIKAICQIGKSRDNTLKTDDIA